MALNPETNKFEPVEKPTIAQLEKLIGNGEKVDIRPDGTVLVRSDGSAIPKHWSVFKIGETVVIKDYTFRVAYIGESNILFEPVSPVIASPAGGAS